MIKPTNGRVVWFTPASNFPGAQIDREQPLAAIVCHVHGNRLINLVVTDSNGDQHPMPLVTLLQDEDARPSHGGFAEWMPYQKGQAAKTEQLENTATGS